MRRFRSILVYLDRREESRQALKAGLGLAERHGAQLTVMDVVDDICEELTDWPEAELRRIEHAVIEQRRFELEEAVRAYRSSLPIQVAVAVGKPSLELIRRVITHRHDLVIKTARAKVNGRRVYFGTTAMHLIRKCPSPVWIVPPTAIPTSPRVLAAVDPVSRSRYQASFARRVLEYARVLAEHLGGSLDVVHAWEARATATLLARGEPQDTTRYVDSVYAASRYALDELERTPGQPAGSEHFHLVRGQPEDEIPRFAVEQQSDVVVLGSVGRRGISGLLIGETAEEILSRIECGVFCVKPDGFVSPLRFDSTRVDRASSSSTRELSAAGSAPPAPHIPALAGPEPIAAVPPRRRTVVPNATLGRRRPTSGAS
jgi:nucleotide-binding universal stress UspA family protein